MILNVDSATRLFVPTLPLIEDSKIRLQPLDGKDVLVHSILTKAFDGIGGTMGMGDSFIDCRNLSPTWLYACALFRGQIISNDRLIFENVSDRSRYTALFFEAAAGLRSYERLYQNPLLQVAAREGVEDLLKVRRRRHEQPDIAVLFRVECLVPKCQ